MAGKPPLVTLELQESMTAWGLSLKVYRNQNGISQQVFHDWSKETGNTLWNSQLAYAERGLLQPKGGGFFIAFGEWNNFLVKGDFKSIKNKTLRERLEQCKPYLNHEGKPANATDFFSLFIGQSPINELYTKTQKELTEDFVSEYFALVVETFEDIRREHMYKRNELWQALCETKPMQKIEKKVKEGAQDALIGEYVPDLKTCRYIISTYNGCPLYNGLEIVSDHPLPKKLREAHTDLVSLAA
tara:strand:+ start:422 stop:1150 length:729 start_codon:yes stop_codon:yes gene_type:complete